MVKLCKLQKNKLLKKVKLTNFAAQLFGILIAGQASSENIQTGLKTFLEDDWGYVLSLQPGPNGNGNRADPFKITATEPNEISRTAFFTLQGLHRGLSEVHKDESDMVTGVLWKVVNPLQVDLESSTLFMRVERKILTQSEEISETVSYHFSLVNDKLPINVEYLLPIGFHSEELKLKMPFEVGYLQYAPNQTVDYAEEYNRPDLGYGLAFNAIGVKATAYIYPLPNFVSDTTLLDEFEKSVDSIQDFSEEKLEALDEDIMDGRLYRKSWVVGENAEKATSLWLFSFKDQFVKLRITWKGDHVINSVATEFPDLFVTELFKNYSD